MKVCIFVEKHFHVRALLHSLGVENDIRRIENAAGLVGYAFELQHDYLVVPVMSTLYVLDHIDRIRRRGYECFVRLGTCGAIEVSGELGRLCMVERCVNLDCVSASYLPPEVPGELPIASSVMTEIFADLPDVIGVRRHYTIDLMWQPFEAVGVDTVDMETSALYRYAAVHGLPSISFSILRDRGPRCLAQDEVEARIHEYAPTIFERLEGVEIGRVAEPGNVAPDTWSARNARSA